MVALGRPSRICNEPIKQQSLLKQAPTMIHIAPTMMTVCFHPVGALLGTPVLETAGRMAIQNRSGRLRAAFFAFIMNTPSLLLQQSLRRKLIRNQHIGVPSRQRRMNGRDLSFAARHEDAIFLMTQTIEINPDSTVI